jgi:hypothetical protein
MILRKAKLFIEWQDSIPSRFDDLVCPDKPNMGRNNFMPVKCFYHADDFDGHCSGAIVKRARLDADLIPANYEMDQDVLMSMIGRGDEVYLVDFSFSPERMVILHETNPTIWIDHHEVAINKMKELGISFPGLQEVGKAACELAWRFFFPKELMPTPVFLLGRYDVFDLTARESVEPFQFGLRSHETDPSVNGGLNMRLWTDLFDPIHHWEWVDDIVTEGRVIMRYVEQENEKYYRRFAFSGVFDGHHAVFLNKGQAGSAAFFNQTKGNESLCVAFARLPDDKWVVDIYSDNPKIHCGEIAARHGGGGHRGAAGFICQELPF